MTRMIVSNKVDRERGLRFSRVTRTGGSAVVSLVAVWLVLSIGTHLPADLARTELNGLGKLKDHLRPFDKLIHFVGFACLTTLLCQVTQPKQRPPGRSLARYALVASSLLVYACADEYTQHFVPGRVPDLRDLLADAAGVLVGIALYGVASHWMRRETRLQPGQAVAARLVAEEPPQTDRFAA